MDARTQFGGQMLSAMTPILIDNSRKTLKIKLVV
jgi:hypothetical protein